MSTNEDKKKFDDQTPESDTMEQAEGSRETVEAELGGETDSADTTSAGGGAAPEDKEPAEGGRETVEAELEDGNDK